MQLGDIVRVKPTYRYAADWRGEFIVIGLRLLETGKIDVTISEIVTDRHGHWLSPTDGFVTDDLEVVPPSEMRPLTDPERAGFWGFVNSIGR